MVLLCWGTLIASLGMNYSLLAQSKEPMSDVLVALIGGVCGGSNIGYLVQNTLRCASLNKNGLTLEDGEVVKIADG